MRLLRTGKCHVTGFTLVELVIVIVVIGVLAAAVTFSESPPQLTVPSQAEVMASQIRTLQGMAQSGRRTRLTIVAGTNGTYTGLRCLSDDCASTEQVMSVTLDKALVLGGTASLDFDSRGQPSAAAAYTLTSGIASKTVSVAAVSGFVTVAP